MWLFKMWARFFAQRTAKSEALPRLAPVIHLDVIRACHREWAKALLSAEWQLGPRDDKKQIHPLLYPEWESLPDAEKRMDLDLLEFYNRKYLQNVGTARASTVELCKLVGQKVPKQTPVEIFIDELSVLFINVRRG